MTAGGAAVGDGVRPSPLRAYALAVKPGIVVSNTMLAAGCYVFAAPAFSVRTFLGLVLGSALVVGSACVLNNYFDRAIDARMPRTATRGQVTGAISVRASVVYCAVLGVTGAVVLLAEVNALTCGLGLAAWMLYALVYTWAKHRTVHSTLIGTIPGAIPPVAGAAAAGQGLSLDALLLFLLLVAWQLAHFYAISIRRRDEYRAAGVPVAAVVYGVTATKRLILAATAAYLAVIPLESLYGSAGIVFAIVNGLYGLVLFGSALRGQPRTVDADRWANRIFAHSLAMILLLSVLLFFNRALP